MEKIRRMLIIVIYVRNHLEDNISWIERLLKIILKNRFVSPCPYVPASHQKDSCSLFILNSMRLVVDILKDPISTIKRK